MDDEDVYRRGSAASGKGSGTSPGSSSSLGSPDGKNIEMTKIGGGGIGKFSGSDDEGEGGSFDKDDDKALLSPLVMKGGSLSLEGPTVLRKDGLLKAPPITSDITTTTTTTSSSYVDDGHGTHPPGTATTSQVVINIIISFVGAGLLGIPYAMQKSGWLLGSICLLVVSGLNLYAMLLLPQVQTTLITRRGYDPMTLQTYGDLGRCIIGPAGETLVNICLCISQAGFATAYIIFIAANLYSIAQWNRALVCTLCMPGLMWLVQFRDLKHLSPFSLLANCSNFCALSAVLFQDWETYQPHNDTIHAVKWDGFLYIVAITLYSIEGVGMVLSLEASCKDRHSFPGILRLVLGCISLFMAFFGSAGYLAFGNQTMAPITLNLAGHWSSTFVKCALCLGLYLTYPIMMFPVWTTTEGLLPRMKQDPKLRAGFRCSLVLCSTFIAYSFPDFGEFLSLVGSSICTILGLILPCYFSLKVQWDESPYWKIGLNYFLFLGGILFGILGTYNSFKDMWTSDDDGDDFDFDVVVDSNTIMTIEGGAGEGGEG